MNGPRRRIARLTLLPLVFALSACATSRVPEQPARAETRLMDLPPMKVFEARSATSPTRSNRELVRDFLDLSFEMESGRKLPFMTRFEGPISVRVTGIRVPTLDADLDKLLSRLRNEASINISRVPPDSNANITIEALPRSALRRTVPQAACFVAPRVSSWREFRANRRGERLDWTTLNRRETVTVFLPGDVSPQEVRDCLHEELAQALGPLNDLYRLPDSVFNDDNFHTVLTGFDMLMLRAYYSPELANGMPRDRVAQVLPGLLRRINPRGESVGTFPYDPTPREWSEAISTALGADSSTRVRRAAADDAVRIARARGWRDNRLAFALFVQARLLAPSEVQTVLSQFLAARAIYAERPQTRLQAAHLSAHLAIFALASGRPDKALELADEALGVVSQAENAILLSTLLLTRAEALAALGREEEAASVRREALGWARYGFGNPSEIRARIDEIAALTPRRRVTDGNVQPAQTGG